MTKTIMSRFDDEAEAHLARYLANREKRTGEKWVVVERYTTGTLSRNWDRALIRRVEDGSTLRIFHTGYYWRVG